MTFRKPLPGFPTPRTKLPNMNEQLERSQHEPYIGVTQGGSSKKYPGCKPAATNGVTRAVTPQGNN